MKILRRLSRTIVLFTGLLALASPTAAQDGVRLVFGNDHYAAGQQTRQAMPVPGDMFLAGYDVTLAAPVRGSAHMGGFNVTSNAEVDTNLYMAGFTANVNAPVAGNVTATGSTVSVAENAAIAGNARLSGASVTLAGPVGGSALVAADALTLAGSIDGDFNFYGRTITFEPGAQVAGNVTIHAPEEISIPASVAPASRVSFERLEDVDYVGEAGRTAENVARGLWPVIGGLIAFMLILVLAGAVLLALFPHRIATMQAMAATRPFRSIGWGILTFAMLLGLVPVTALTVIGILALPVVFIFIVLCFGFAYVLGIYLVGTRIAGSFAELSTNPKRLGVLAGSLVIAVLLGFVPFIGWLLTLMLMIFGLGATTRTMIMPRPGGGGVQSSPVGPSSQPTSV